MESTITNEVFLQKLTAKFGDAIISSLDDYGMLTVTADSSKNIEILNYLYDEPSLQVQFMTDLTGVHYPEQELAFCVVYHLHSLVNNYRVRFKFFIGGEIPTIATATSVFATANWMERETYDFFGIIFEGHPDLRRILNVDEMVAFPLRKEFPLEDPNRIDKQDYYFGR